MTRWTPTPQVALLWPLAVVLSAVACTALLGVDKDYVEVPEGELTTTGGNGGTGGATTTGGSGGAVPQPDGTSCSSASSCMSGHCTDGVCCAAACQGLCESCRAAATGSSDGTCASVTAGTDPDGECDGEQSCNGDGACDDTGSACGAPGECSSGFCVDGFCCQSECQGVCQGCSAALTGGAEGQCASIPALQDPDDECAGGETCDGNGACFSCGVAASPPGTVCPAECTDCNSGVCRIDCSSEDCSGTVTCPNDWACQVECPEAQDCNGGTIECPPTYACEVLCEGTHACDGAAINCGSGPCALTCGSGSQACVNATLSCGDDLCSATCTGASFPTVQCGTSCFCTDC